VPRSDMGLVLALRADPEESHMAVNGAVSAGGFQLGKQSFQRGVFNLNFGVALAADQVMMIVVLCQFVDHFPVSHMRGKQEFFFCQFLQRSVDGWLG